jgi:hypothetical protein
MRLLAKNIGLGLALVSIPLLAEGVAGLNAQAPGAGVRMLLYWPVNFALIAFALAAFICLNAYALRQRAAGVLLGALTGLFVSAIWFGVAFLVVFQVHLWRGGQL